MIRCFQEETLFDHQRKNSLAIFCCHSLSESGATHLFRNIPNSQESTSCNEDLVFQAEMKRGRIVVIEYYFPDKLRFFFQGPYSYRIYKCCSIVTTHRQHRVIVRECQGAWRRRVLLKHLSRNRGLDIRTRYPISKNRSLLSLCRLQRTDSWC